MVYFFLIRGKNRDFGFWLPENRIIEEITSSKIQYSSQATCAFTCYMISQDSIKTLIKNARVDYDRSLTRENPRKYALNSGIYNFYLKIDRKHNAEILSILKAGENKACDCQ